jgi:dimethylamine monooxygenase subunit A
MGKNHPEYARSSAVSSICLGRDEDGGQPLYFPFALGRYRMSLGLQALPSEEWIQIDGRFIPYLQQKQARLQQHYDESVSGLPGTEAAQQELLNLLLDHLPQRFPAHYQCQGTGIANLKTGEIWHSQDFSAIPIDLAGRLVQEDLCLMVPSEQGYILGAASLCFPLHWRLKDKLGQALADIHAPVPGYASRLQQPVDHYFDRLQSHAAGYRFNWSLVGSPDLALEPETASQPVNSLTPENMGENLWIRVERQTLRRLPETRAIVFGIRTYVYPLSLLENYPQAALGLSQAIHQVPGPMKMYKHLEEHSETLQGYLDRIIRSHPALID